jgi:hypothetical protein
MEDSFVFDELDNNDQHDWAPFPSIIGDSRLDVSSSTTSMDLQPTTDSGEVLGCTFDGKSLIPPPPPSLEEDFVTPS